MLTNLFLKMLNREASSPQSKAPVIIQALNLTAGKAVADIGAGGGYFTLALAQKVGQGGKVLAVDTNPKHLEFVRRNAEKAGLNNIVIVAAGGNAVPWPEASLDLVFARNVFHHLSDPAGYFQRLKKALKPEGMVAIIDHLPGRGFSFVNIFKHFTPAATIHQVMLAAGYRLLSSFDFLPQQSFTIWSSNPD